MQNSSRFLGFVFSLIIATHCRPAAAELILGFSSNEGGSFSNSFDVNVGSGLNIGVYLQQSVPDTVLTSDGLVSWGFDLTRTSTGTGNLSFLGPNRSFDIENHKVISSNGLELEYAQSSGLGVKGDSILLGSLQFNAIAEGSSLFTFKDRLIGSGLANASWLTPALSNLDEQIFGNGAAGTYQFEVNATAVPEPSSFVLLSTAAGLIFLWRRRTKTRLSASNV